MELNKVIGDLNNELKKKPLDQKNIVSKINLLINTYNKMINVLKSKTTETEDTEELKKEIQKGKKDYKKKVIDLSTIFEIAKELSSSLNIDNLIKTLILTSVGHMLVETGIIFVLDEKLKKYVFKDSKGIKRDLNNISFDIDDLLIKYIIEKSDSILIKDLLSESFADKYKDVFKQLNCELLVPIIIKSKLNGILFLGPKMGGLQFTESNLEFLIALGNFAAIAIENARLYENLDKKVKDLSTLYDISREINKSKEINIIVDLLISTITTGFGVKKCSIILYNEINSIFYIEKNYKISDEQAKKYLDLIIKNQIENPLHNNKSILIYKHKIISSDDIFYSIPLVAGDRKVGLINIYQFEESILIDEEVKQIFSIIASQMAPPIMLAAYLSNRDTYRENPFDYIYHNINNMIIKAKESGIGFVTARLKIKDNNINFDKVKGLILKIRPILQETDILIHSNLNEVILIFPATPVNEVEKILNDFIPGAANINIEHKYVTYPEDGEEINSLLSKLYQQE